MRLLFTILQVALSVFWENPERAAGNLCGYFPQDTLVSEVPEGYKPFYISHIARHGSRFHLSKTGERCFQAVDTLVLYKDQLTQDGLALLEDIQMMRDMSADNYGELTELGAKEHRQICERMVRHYPEVFANAKRSSVVAYSTSSPRVVASMEAFLGELKEHAPDLDIKKYVTNYGKDLKSREVTGREYLVKGKLREKVQAKRKELGEVGDKILEDRGGFNVFAERIFLDPSKIPAATVEDLAKMAFGALKTGRVTEPETMPSMGKYFTPEELFILWAPGNIAWLRFVNLPGYESPMVQEVGDGIRERMIKDADKAISCGSNAAATLRFSHDSNLVPLMASLSLEGTVFECPDTELLEHFQTYNVVCPACNVQIIFYRADRGPVLVKFLLNEKETLIHGLTPTTGCYYDWESAKSFWAKHQARTSLFPAQWSVTP